MSQQIATNSLLSGMAKTANLDPAEFKATLMATVMPSNVQVTEAQFMAFLMVADKYDLNPVTKEIYAFPANGGIQPIVSIDGWLKIINTHPQFDGMEFKDTFDQSGKLTAVTCKIFRKDRGHPIEVTEYMSECKRNTKPWQQFEARMLRHKATIQTARYAFSLSGIYDPDEGERIAETSTGEKVIEGAVEPVAYPAETFDTNFPAWQAAVVSGKRTHAEIIAMVESKGALNDGQKGRINDIKIPEDEA